MPLFAALFCIAEAVYFESRNQPPEGQIAVAQVVLNRAEDSDACTVVHKPKQFTYYWDGKPEVFLDQAAYQQAHYYALISWLGIAPDMVGKRTHYDNSRTRPPWTYGEIVRIGDHYFYFGEPL